MDLDYFEDWTPRGPAGCIRDAAADRGAQRLVVTEASIIPTCDLGAVLAAHARSGAALTVVAAPEPAGRGEEWIPAGIYVLEHDVLAHIPDTGYQDLKEKLLPRLHERGVPTAMYRLAAPCPRLRDAASYLALNAWALGRLLRSPARPGFGRVAHGLVHGSARVAAGARLVGPVLVGPGCQVAAGATLLGPVVLGAGTAIAAGAVVSRSVLWNNCRVGRNAVVDQSVCGDGASVEAEASLRRTVGRPAAPGAARGREAGWPHRLRGWLARRGRAAAALDPQRGLEPALAAR